MYIFLLTCENVISGGNPPPVVAFPFNFGLLVLGLRSNKNVKKANIKNLISQKVPKYPKEHFYQLLDQLTHFPETSSKFCVKSGYARSGPKKRKKNTVFRSNNGDFLADFCKIFKINKNHLITLYDQISGQLKHF